MCAIERTSEKEKEKRLPSTHVYIPIYIHLLLNISCVRAMVITQEFPNAILLRIHTRLVIPSLPHPSFFPFPSFLPSFPSLPHSLFSFPHCHCISLSVSLSTSQCAMITFSKTTSCSIASGKTTGHSRSLQIQLY